MIRLRCFHGTSYENAQSILREQNFRNSDNDQLRMGVGAYFFCQAGKSDRYALRCAKELEKFHRNKHKDGYAILSCDIECSEDEYLDLYDPEVLEMFHEMRYYILNKSLSVDKEYKYKNAAVADTQVFNVIRNIRNLSVIRCPQFFGMFAEEQKFIFSESRQFPKTFVPNVIMVCVDTNKAVVKNIELVEGGLYSDEHAEII